MGVCIARSTAPANAAANVRVMRSIVIVVTDHKTVGLQYAVTSSFFLFVGFVLMLLMRWQLAWPAQPLPPWLFPMVGDANAPGGILLPESDNQLVAMHGTVMIFLAVVPLATGGSAPCWSPG